MIIVNLHFPVPRIFKTALRGGRIVPAQSHPMTQLLTLWTLFLFVTCSHSFPSLFDPPRNVSHLRPVTHRNVKPPRSSANSCTRFVSPAGSDANPGSLSAPWQSLNYSFSHLRPGDTLCLRGGTYPQTVSSGYNQVMATSGTSSSPITITNYPGEVAIIHGNTRVQTSFVTFRGTPSNTVHAGLIFEGPTGQRLGMLDVMHSHDVTFDHIEVRGDDYHAGFYQYGGYNIQLLGSYIHDNGRPGYINTDQGVYWDATTGGGSLIANCVVEHNAAMGIQLYPSPSQVTVENNTIVFNANYGMVVYGSQNTIVNNIFADNGSVAKNPQLKIVGARNSIVDSNLFWSSIPALRGYWEEKTDVRVTHAVVADPMFLDPSGHDYHLNVGSPALGSGNTHNVRAFDKDGLRRAQPSIGAYAASEAERPKLRTDFLNRGHMRKVDTRNRDRVRPMPREPIPRSDN